MVVMRKVNGFISVFIVFETEFRDASGDNLSE